MLYGNKSLGFFEDMNSALDAVPIPIIKKDGSLQLEAGLAHGVCDGDHFVLRSIGPAEQDPGSERDQVILEVTHARALTSDLKLLHTRQVPNVSGFTATALTHLSLRRFPVRLELRLPCQNVWAIALQERRSLDVKCTDNVKPGTPFSFYVAIIAKDSYEIRDESNQRIPDLPASPYDLEENADYVLDIVEHLARFKLMESLVNSSLKDSTNPFKKSFSVQIVTADRKIFHPGCLRLGPFSPGCSHSECLVEVEDGNMVKLVVENKEKELKEGGRPLHVHLYGMNSCWEIENLLCADHEVIPPAFSNENKEDFKEGTDGKWEKKIKMTVPQELRDKGQHQCDDIFKVFLTFQSTSFMLLELPELGKLVERRGISRGNGQHPGLLSEDWVVLNFRIRTHIK